MLFPKMPGTRRSRRAKKNTPPVFIFLVLLGGIGTYFQLKWMRTDIIAVEAEKMMSARVPCYHCDGNGRLISEENFNEFNPCPVCYGVGFRSVWTRPGLRDFCPECIGMGTIVDDALHSARCARCEGWGTIAVPLDDVRIRELENSPDPVSSSDRRLVEPSSIISPDIVDDKTQPDQPGAP